MKLKFKALAAAAVMVVAGHASAALSDTFVQDGTLFLSVYDTVTNNSYTRDLGVSLNSFLPAGSLVSAAGTTLGSSFANFAGSGNFTSLFTGATASNIRWNIIGVDSTQGDGLNNGQRVVTTYSNASPAFAPDNGGIRNAAGTSTQVSGELLANSGVDFSGTPADGAFAGQALASYGGKSFQNVLDGTGGLGFFVNNFGAAQFWFAGTGTDAAGNAAAATVKTRFGNSANFATFTLDTGGNVTYALAAAPAAVPIPAAAWLMGSGLLGLGGFIRRRKAAMAA